MKAEEKVFTNWTVKELLGTGAFGKVYRIEREEFGMTYQAAMKKIVIPQTDGEVEDALNEGMSADDVTGYFKSFVEDIVSEFKLMSRLKGHSNIVSYEDHYVISHEDGVGWDILIRMELLKSLKALMAERSLTEAEVIKLGIDLCSALEACGKINIIHRDIKPENIFISSFGEFKLGDFGIARTAEKTMSNLSKKGTYTYMAPEVYRGERYGATVDIYSLGIVMYRFMNHNRAPFLPAYPQPISFSDREASMARRVGNEPMPAPACGSDELKRIILKACAYNPSDRYQSPAQFKEELQKLMPGAARTAAWTEGEASEETVSQHRMPKEAPEETKTVSIFETHEKIAAAPPRPEPVPEPVPEKRPKNGKGILIGGCVAAAILMAAVIFMSTFGGRQNYDYDDSYYDVSAEKSEAETDGTIQVVAETGESSGGQSEETAEDYSLSQDAAETAKDYSLGQENAEMAEEYSLRQETLKADVMERLKKTDWDEVRKRQLPVTTTGEEWDDIICIAEFPEDGIRVYGYNDAEVSGYGVGVDFDGRMTYCDWYYNARFGLPDCYWNRESRELQMAMHTYTGTGASADELYLLREVDEAGNMQEFVLEVEEANGLCDMLQGRIGFTFDEALGRLTLVDEEEHKELASVNVEGGKVKGLELGYISNYVLGDTIRLRVSPGYIQEGFVEGYAEYSDMPELEAEIFLDLDLSGAEIYDGDVAIGIDPSKAELKFAIGEIRVLNP